VDGIPMFRVCKKLKAVKKILKAKNIEVFGGIKQRVLQAKARLDCAPV
jgi:pentose-5-phosphate-3-epimerase